MTTTEAPERHGWITRSDSPNHHQTTSGIRPEHISRGDGHPEAIFVGWGQTLVGAGDTQASRMQNLRDALLKGAELLDVALRSEGNPQDDPR